MADVLVTTPEEPYSPPDSPPLTPRSEHPNSQSNDTVDDFIISLISPPHLWRILQALRCSDGQETILEDEELKGALQEGESTPMPETVDDLSEDQLQDYCKQRMEYTEQLRAYLVDQAVSKSESSGAQGEATDSETLRNLLREIYHDALADYIEDREMRKYANTTTESLIARNAQLEAQLAAAQKEVARLRVRRAQARARCNRAQARLHAAALVAKYAADAHSELETRLASLQLHRDMTLMRAFDWLVRSTETDPAAELHGIFASNPEDYEEDEEAERAEEDNYELPISTADKKRIEQEHVQRLMDLLSTDTGLL